MNKSTAEKWTWLLIYGGLLTAGLGVAVQRGGEAFGWFLVAAGSVAAAFGVALIFIRARMP